MVYLMHVGVVVATVPRLSVCRAWCFRGYMIKPVTTWMRMVGEKTVCSFKVWLEDVRKEGSP
jgi:hypothetical protein